MKPSEIKSLIADCHKAHIKRPIHLESSPGTGKTAIPSQVARELGIGFQSIHAPLLQPEDYGFPVISTERDNVSFIVSKEKFPVEGSSCPEEGIFLIDELSQADNSAQKILANLIYEREIHGQRLKSGWTIVTTGNRTTDRAGANRLLTHLRDRLTPVELAVSLDDWTVWALENDVKPEVISFIRFRPDLLNVFDPHSEANATPRSWVDGISQRLGVIKPELEFYTFKGDIGEGPAAEFCAFLKIYRRLPSLDAILLNPDTTPVPTIGTDKDASSVLYALCGGLAHKSTPANFARVLRYVQRMPKEFAVLYVRDATKRHPEIQTTKEFIVWVATVGAGLLA